MKTVKPICGAGRFQWHTGAWFGTLFGSTAFLLAGVLAFLPQSLMLVLVWLACYIGAVTTGVALWSRRGSVDPYPATQLLFLTIGLASTVAILTAYFANQVRLKDLAILLLIPALMLGAHVLERTARRPT